MTLHPCKWEKGIFNIYRVVTIVVNAFTPLFIFSCNASFPQRDSWHPCNWLEIFIYYFLHGSILKMSTEYIFMFPNPHFFIPCCIAPLLRYEKQSRPEQWGYCTWVVSWYWSCSNAVRRFWASVTSPLGDWETMVEGPAVGSGVYTEPLGCESEKEAVQNTPWYNTYIWKKSDDNNPLTPPLLLRLTAFNNPAHAMIQYWQLNNEEPKQILSLLLYWKAVCKNSYLEPIMWSRYFCGGRAFFLKSNSSHLMPIPKDILHCNRTFTLKALTTKALETQDC